MKYYLVGGKHDGIILDGNCQFANTISLPRFDTVGVSNSNDCEINDVSLEKEEYIKRKIIIDEKRYFVVFVCETLTINDAMIKILNKYFGQNVEIHERMV